MANISSAFGSVMIQAQTPELIKKLLQLHEASERTAYYDTTIDFDEKEFDTKIYKVPNEDKYAYESYFSANGRWTFESNVNWFFSPLKGMILRLSLNLQILNLVVTLFIKVKLY